jgi:Holliday junction resolvasome RuvABC endonuclease subunit
MVKNKKIRVLAIDPGTRAMGVALLENRDLIYHGVKTISKGSSPHEKLWEGRRIVLRLINDLKPQILVVENTFFAKNRNSALLNVFADEIKAVGKRKGLKVLGFAPSAVKKAACGNGWAKKDEVARAVVSHYPELRVYLGQNRKWKSRFHSNMFDAIAVGMMVEAKLADFELKRR